MNNRKIHMYALTIGITACLAVMPVFSDIGSEYTIQRWGVEDGLPEGIVTSINRFPDGFLWLTTPRRIVRFDGVNFLTVPEDEWPSGTLLSLRGMYLDKAGKLWVYGAGGALCFHKGAWSHFQCSGNTNDTSDVQLVHDLPDGTVGAVSRKGITVFREVDEEPVFYPARAGGRPFEILSAAIDRDGIVWLAADNSLLTFVNGEYRIEELSKGSKTAIFLKVFTTADGALWVRGAGCVYCLRSGVRSEKTNLRLMSVAVTADGEEWMGAVEGLIRRRNSKAEWILGEEASVPRPSDVLCLKPGDEGCIWAGTSSGLYSLKRRTVSMLRHSSDQDQQMVSALMCRSDDELWCGFNDGGLFTYKNRSFRRVTHERISLRTTIISMLNDEDGGVLLGAKGACLWKLTNDGNISQFLLAEQGDERILRNIFCLLRDTRKRIWVGTLEGLLIQESENKLISAGSPDLRTCIRALCEGASGEIWVGTQSKGLWILSGSNSVTKISRANGLPSDTVNALYCDPDGLILAGTPSCLAVISDQGRLIRCVNQENGLPDEDIRQILGDDEGRWLWLGTGSGIIRLDKETLTAFCRGESRTISARRFGREEGLFSEICSGPQSPLATRMTDGRLLFGTKDGLAVIDPDGILAEMPVRTPQLERITADDTDIWKAPALRSVNRAHDVPGKIQIPGDSLNLEFHFTTPGLSSGSNVRFRYMLGGYDSDWSQPSVSRVALYSRLPPGRYTLKVEACNADGVWNPRPAELICEVPERFWQTDWFLFTILISALLLAGWAGWGLAHALAKRRLARIERDHAIERERARIARDIHDDIGVGLTEIGVLGDLAVQSLPDEQERIVRIHEITGKVRAMVDTLDEIVWAVNPRNDVLKSLCFYATDYIQKFLENAGIRCRLDIPAELPEIPIDPERRHALMMVLKEVINNIVKHSGASEVLFRIRLEQGLLQILIADNGQGFAGGPEREGADGLRGMGERMKGIGGRIEIRSRPGAGTEVSMELAMMYC